MATSSRRATRSGPRTFGSPTVAHRCDHRLPDGARRGHRLPGPVLATTPGKIKGRKRHIAVDALGLLLAVVVTTASIQDRDGAHRLLVALRARFCVVSHVWADGGYTGRLLSWANNVLTIAVEVAKRTDKITGFAVLPRRWVVERTFGWITKHRRCVRDYETLPRHHEAMVTIAMITTMSRRLARTGDW